LKLRDTCMRSDDESVKVFGSNNLVPRAILHSLAAPKSPHGRARAGLPHRA
jgi:hypothetical protein